jgi:hypothetical protein
VSQNPYEITTEAEHSTTQALVDGLTLAVQYMKDLSAKGQYLFHDAIIEINQDMIKVREEAIASWKELTNWAGAQAVVDVDNEQDPDNLGPADMAPELPAGMADAARASMPTEQPLDAYYRAQDDALMEAPVVADPTSAVAAASTIAPEADVPQPSTIPSGETVDPTVAASAAASGSTLPTAPAVPPDAASATPPSDPASPAASSVDAGSPSGPSSLRDTSEVIASMDPTTAPSSTEAGSPVTAEQEAEGKAWAEANYEKTPVAAPSDPISPPGTDTTPTPVAASPSPEAASAVDPTPTAAAATAGSDAASSDASAAGSQDASSPVATQPPTPTDVSAAPAQAVSTDPTPASSAQPLMDAMTTAPAESTDPTGSTGLATDGSETQASPTPTPTSETSPASAPSAEAPSATDGAGTAAATPSTDGVTATGNPTQAPGPTDTSTSTDASSPTVTPTTDPSTSAGASTTPDTATIAPASGAESAAATPAQPAVADSTTTVDATNASDSSSSPATTTSAPSAEEKAAAVKGTYEEFQAAWKADGANFNLLASANLDFYARMLTPVTPPNEAQSFTDPQSAPTAGTTSSTDGAATIVGDATKSAEVPQVAADANGSNDNGAFARTDVATGVGSTAPKDPQTITPADVGTMPKDLL